GVVGSETVYILLELFAIERVEGQQLFDAVDDGHGIGLLLIAVFFFGLGIVHLDQVGRGAAKPLSNAKALQALGDELQFTLHLDGIMNTNCTADLREIIGIGLFAGSGFRR